MAGPSSIDLSRLHGGPSAGFDEPFEMLAACHERVERMLRLLERLAVHLPAHGADAQAGSAARDVMRYFDLAGPAHHEDEERHILPALRAAGQSGLADRLHDDHKWMARAWQGVRADLDGITASRWDAGTAGPVLARWQGFAAHYRSHIALEEASAYPPVQAASDAPMRRAMGDEMARRRGVSGT
jgi:hemerythrin-like domain-containing protein